MNQQNILPFKESITTLESMIRELEINVGVEHKASPFDQYLQVEQKLIQAKEPLQNEKIQEQKQGEIVQEQKGDKKKEEKKKQPEQDKKEKQPKQQPKKEPEVDLGEFTDVVNLDIRVGEIIECWKHPDSVNLYCEKINMGYEVREIASGLQQFLPIEEMKGLVLVFANLKGKKLAGFMSNGMVLCANTDGHTKIEFLRPPAGSIIGERVKIEGKQELFKDELEPVLNPKKKQWENVQPKLKTNEKFEATFDGHVFVTSAGPVKCQSLTQAAIS